LSSSVSAAAAVYTLSLHDALPISISGLGGLWVGGTFELLWPEVLGLLFAVFLGGQLGVRLTLGKLSAKRIRILTGLLVFFVGIRDRKSTRLNSSHVKISYAVFCLK